jgi:hypothetical protein
MLGAACQVDLMGMWPIARVNKPESDNPSILESAELFILLGSGVI